MKNNKNQTYSQTFRLLLGNASIPSTARLTMAIADRIQDEPSQGVRLAALSSAFLLSLELSGLPAADCLGMARNIMNHAEGIRPEFAGVREYLRNEVFSHD